MQRRLVIILSVVGLVVAAAGGFWLWSIFGNGDGMGESINPFGNLIPAGESERSAAQLAASDNDNDGLTNSEELQWGSDPENSDTDGDGYLDGEEIAAGHDPTIPAPNDELGATGQTTTQTQTAAEAERAQRLALLTRGPQLNSYLREDVALEIEGDLTAEYEQAVPAAERSQAGREAFVAARDYETFLPQPSSNELPTAQPDSPALIRQYLLAADNSSVLADDYYYNQATYDLIRSNKSLGVSLMLKAYTDYRESLKEVPVPQGAVAVHTLLLAYTQAQIITLEQIENYKDDEVKGLAAMRQYEGLYKVYYPIITAEFERLSALANTLGG